jgi:hypothetical protein
LNKDRYVGWFDSGVKQGQGTYYYHNGDRYQGEFRQGRRGGYGIFYFAKGPWLFALRVLTASAGDRYEGEFKNDKRHGKGVLHWVSGNRYGSPSLAAGANACRRGRVQRR